MREFSLDFVAPNLEFVAPGLDLVAENLDFRSGAAPVVQCGKACRKH
jgi:hypothetical protein